jgi:hypothetical protein
MRRWLAKQSFYSPIAAGTSINRILDRTPRNNLSNRFCAASHFPLISQQPSGEDHDMPQGNLFRHPFTATSIPEN